MFPFKNLIPLNPESPQAIYVQLANGLIRLIRSGKLQPGTKLPSITNLAKEWNVARSTAAQAINRLQVEQAVHTSTQGTFVASAYVSNPAPTDAGRDNRGVDSVDATGLSDEALIAELTRRLRNRAV